LRAQRSNPLLRFRPLDCFIAALLAMTKDIDQAFRRRMGAWK
jgi:hypothetical protein